MRTLPEVGTLLAERRRRLGKTQREVGQLAGLRQEQVSRLEQGRLPDFSASKLLRLANALGLTLSLRPADAASPTLTDVLEEVRSGQNRGPGG